MTSQPPRRSLNLGLTSWFTANRVSLRKLLFIPFLVQLLGTVGLVGFLSFRSGKQAVEDLADQLIQQTSRRVHDRLNEYLDTAQRTIAINRHVIESGQLDANNLNALQTHFLGVLKLHENFVTLGYSSSTGHSILVARDRATVVLPVAGYLVAETPDPKTQENYTYSLDDQGRRQNLVQTVPNYDPRQTILYKTAVERGKPAWTPIHPLVLAPLAATLAVTPVVQKGQIQGVLFATVPMDNVSNFLSQLDFSPQGQVFVIERSGDLVATSTLEQAYTVAGTPDQRQLNRVNVRNSQDPLTQATARSLLDQFGSLETLQRNQLTFVEQIPAENGTSNRERYFTRVMPFRDDRGIDWLIVTVVPESDFAAQIYANLRQTIALCLLATIGSTALSFWLARTIAKPLKTLSQTTKIFADGNLDQPVKSSWVKEVDELTIALRQMADQIDTSFQNLAQSEQKFATLLEALPIGVVVANPEGQIFLHNRASYALAEQELQPAEVGQISEVYHAYKAGTDQLYPPNELPLVKALGGESVTVDDIEIRANGRQVPIEATAVSIFDQQGNLIYAIAIFQDISDRRETERLRVSYAQDLERQVAEKTAALQKSQAELAEILNSSAAAISRFQVFADYSYQILHVSAGAAEIVGYPADVLKADQNLWISRIEPDDWAKICDRLFADIFAGREGTYEYRLRNRTGKLRWISQTNNSRWDAVQNCWFTTAVSLDVSDRKQAEIQLQQYQQLLEGILNSIDSAVWSVSYPDLKPEYVSPGAEKIYHRLVQEFATNPNLWLEVIHPEDRQVALSTVSELQALGSFKVEKRILRPNGEVRWIIDQAWLVRDLAGNPVRVDGIATDITDRKHLERRLAESLDFRQQLFHQSPDALFLVDPETLLITDCNQRAVEVFEVADRTALIGKAGHVFQKDPFFPHELAAISQEIAEQGFWKMELKFVTHQGREFWGDLSAKAIMVGDRQINLVRLVDISDRKQAELALAENETRFRKLAEASPAIIYTVVEYPFEGASRFEYLSPAAAAMHELPIADLQNNAALVFEQIHPDDRYNYAQAVATSLATMQPFFYEWRIITPSGKIKWLQGNSRPERRENGEVVWHGIVIEVTDRKQAELALEQALREISYLVENTPLATIAFDRDMHIQNWSRRAEEMFGWPAQEVLGKTVWEFPWIMEADLPKIQQVVVNLRRGRSQFCQNRNYRKDGSILHCEWYNSVLRDEAGEVVSILSLTADVSDRVQAEVALQAKTEELDNFFTNSLDLFCIADTHGYFRRLNPQWAEVLGYRLDELEGRSFLELVHPDDLEATQAAIVQLAHRQPVLNFVNRYLHRDGSYRWIEWRASQPDNSLIYAAARDISDQVQTQEQLQAALAEKEILLRELQHRVKNNLQMIHSMLRMQRRRINNPEAINALKESGDRVLALSLAHQSLQQSGSLAEIDLACYLPTLIASLQQSSNHDCEIRIIQQIDPIVVPIKVAMSCGLILNELVTNALKYAFPDQQTGEILITLTWEHGPETQDSQSVDNRTPMDLNLNPTDSSDALESGIIRIRIKDDGIGLPDGFDLSRIRSLGLVLVQDLVEQLHGQFDITSQGGTQVQITFPDSA